MYEMVWSDDDWHGKFSCAKSFLDDDDKPILAILRL